MSETTSRSDTLTWADVFPWLKSATDGTVDDWWEEPAWGSNVSKRYRHVEEVAELAISEYARWTLAQLFPTVPNDLALDLFGLPSRALNLFARFDCRTFEDVSKFTVEQILDWRHFGAGTACRALEAFAAQALTHAEWSDLAGTRGGQADLSGPQPEADGWSSSALAIDRATVDDLRLVAEWFALVGKRDVPILTARLPGATPPAVASARKRLELSTSDDVLGSGGGSGAAEILGQSIGRLDSRSVSVLRDRVFADTPKTLDSIGSKFGVTRERIRQIESKARTALYSELVESGDCALSALAQAVRQTIDERLPLSALLEELPSLQEFVDVIEQPAWRVLDRLDDAYEIHDAWCAAPTVEAARASTVTLVEEVVDRYGVAPLASLNLINIEPQDIRLDLSARWLEYCGYLIEGGHVFTRTQSVQDYAASILSVVGSPLAADEIVARFRVERSVRSLRNALAKDDRFARVDRDRWGLSEWGLEIYSDIRSLIREELAKNGGSAALEPMVQTITSKYSVSASSVVSYASSAPFETNNGVVTFATELKGPRKSPTETRRMFKRAAGWVLRVTVTKDHLRGSGSVAPTAVATILELIPGQVTQLPSQHGPQLVAWTGIQPAFGTIRRFLQHLDVAAGDEVFLVIGDDGTFSVERMNPLVNDPLFDAVTLSGGVPEESPLNCYEKLCNAVGVSGSAGVSSLIGIYRDRGDVDIADCLLAARGRLEEIDEAVDDSATEKADIADILDLL